MRVVAAVCFTCLAVPASAQTPAVPEGQGQAYFEFLQARRLESEGDLEGALAALRRAETLDPEAADLLAERAALHARSNDGPAAIAAGERALALDKNNSEAHRILGLVYAAWADGAAPPPAGETAATLQAKAVEHLKAIRGTPVMATDLSLQIAYGRLLLRGGSTDEAITVLEGVATQAPYVAEPFVLLADAHTAQGRLEDAARALEQAADVNPRYFVSLGELYERLGRWAQAAGAYGQAVAGMRTPSRDLRLRHVTALLNVPGGAGAEEARDALAGLLETSPNDARLLYLQTMALRQLREYPEAETIARRMLNAEPTSLVAINALARVLSEQFKYRDVIELLTPLSKDIASRASGREGEAAMALAQLGLAHQQLGAFDSAIEVFTSAQRVADTGSQSAYGMYLAQALVAARQYDRALQVTGDALRQSPGEPRLLRLRAQALSRMGRTAEAITLLEGATDDRSKSPQLALALADAYAAEKRYDEAVRVIEQAETAFGEDEEFTFRRVSLYEDAGRLSDAERELRALIERDPLDASALNHLGYLLADRTDRAAEAVTLIERALKVEPDNPAYLDSLGWALFKQGKIDEAARPIGRAAEALPANSVIQEHHGDVLARQGKWTEAVAAWQRALDGDGESINRAGIEQKIRDGRRRR